MSGGAFRIGRYFGIPVYAHITLLIVLPVLALHVAQGARVGLAWGLVGAVGFFASIVLHELGHSLVAMSRGGRVREILLLPIGGMAQLDRMPSDPRAELWIAVAGPAVSLGLAVLCFFSASLLASMRLFPFARLVGLLGSVNLALALFNLLPSFPMDGGRIFRAWLTPRLGRLLATTVAARVGRFMAVLFGIVALFRWNPFLLLIALFVYQAAGAEARMVRMQEGWRPEAGFRGRPGTDMNEQDVYVSPPPYARHRSSDFVGSSLRASRNWFDELFEKWR